MSEETTIHETEGEHVARAFARGLVIAGGLFWAVAAFAGPYAYDGLSVIESVKVAMWPFLAAVVILIAGWTYERLAAVLLFAASAAVLVWGSLYSWEPGVWIIMSCVLIAPMTVAGVLYLYASRAEAQRMAQALRAAAEASAFEIPGGSSAQVRPH